MKVVNLYFLSSFYIYFKFKSFSFLIFLGLLNFDVNIGEIKVNINDEFKPSLNDDPAILKLLTNVMAFNNSITNCEIFYNGILKSVNIFSSSSSSSLTNKSSSNSNSKNNGPSNNELMAMMMNKKGNENVDNHYLKRASKSTLFNEHLFFLQAKSSNNNKKKSSAIVNYNKNNNKLKSAPFKPHFSWLDLIYVGQYKNVHYSQYLSLIHISQGIVR